LRRYKSPGTDQILADVIQAGGNILCSKIHKEYIKVKGKFVPVLN